MNNLTLFLKKKNIEISAKRYLLDALSAMAQGLFASLLIGTIFNTIGTLTGIHLFNQINEFALIMAGPAIAVSVAWALKAPPLVMFSMAIVGAVGYGLNINNLAGSIISLDITNSHGDIVATPLKEIIESGMLITGKGLVKGTVGNIVGGGPIGAFIAATISTEFGKFVSKETKIDIILTPAITIITGTLIGLYVGPYISYAMGWIGNIINFATQQQPILMGSLVSLIMGMALTLPISSAAIAISLGLNGLAAGASTVGCCTQMIGFAVMSFKANGWGGLVAQGVGTSMLQIPNIIKNYKIWIPPTLASILIAPLATTLFKMENIPVAAGMGTSGLVGPIGTITTMTANPDNHLGLMWAGILLLQIILPALITYLIYRYCKKIKWIKDEDLKLDL